MQINKQTNSVQHDVNSDHPTQPSLLSHGVRLGGKGDQEAESESLPCSQQQVPLLISSLFTALYREESVLIILFIIEESHENLVRKKLQ